jgi:hypothetical protein
MKHPQSGPFPHRDLRGAGNSSGAACRDGRANLQAFNNASLKAHFELLMD